MADPRQDALDFISKKSVSKEKEAELKKEEKEVETPETQEEETNVLSNKQEVEEEKSIEIDDSLLFKFAGEKLGREVNSWDDFITEKEVEKEVIKEKEYQTEFAKKYEDFYHQTARSPEDFLRSLEDISKKSEEQVIKESLMSQNPNLDRSEIDFLYNQKYRVDPEEMTDSEIRSVEINRKIDYNKGVRELEEIQKKFAIPKDNSPASLEAKAKEQQEQAQKANELWAETVARDNANMSGIEIDLGEDFKFTHKIIDESKKSVKEVASDPTLQKFYQRYQKEDGSYDSLKYQIDLYKLDNMDKIVADAVEQAKAVTTEAIEKKDKNISFKSDKKPSIKRKLSKGAEQSLDLMKAKYRIK